jgi:hypothetical protein
MLVPIGVRMSGPGPGWYDDGVAAGRKRWWDGSSWTDDYSPDPGWGRGPWRIVRWPYKLLYAVGVWAVAYGIAWPLRLPGVPEIVPLVVGFALPVAAVIVGARIFRTRGEPIRPPRAWWRMTGRSTLSQVVGVLCTIYFVIAIIAVIAAFTLLQFEIASTRGVVIGEAVVAGLLAFLYLNSAARIKLEQRRAGATAPSAVAQRQDELR